MTSETIDLGSLPFQTLVARIETLSSGHGLADVISLYSAWIDAQPKGARDVYGGWFNLATELSVAGSSAAAVAAYRNALVAKPDFHPAAINLGLLLERHGQTDAALGVWADALQDDDFQELVRHDIQLAVAHKSTLMPALMAAYKKAPRAGRQFIEKTLAELDPSMLAAIRTENTQR